MNPPAVFLHCKIKIDTIHITTSSWECFPQTSSSLSIHATTLPYIPWRIRGGGHRGHAPQTPNPRGHNIFCPPPPKKRTLVVDFQSFSKKSWQNLGVLCFKYEFSLGNFTIKLLKWPLRGKNRLQKFRSTTGSQLCELVTWYGGRFPPLPPNRRLDPPLPTYYLVIDLPRRYFLFTYLGHGSVVYHPCLGSAWFSERHEGGTRWGTQAYMHQITGWGNAEKFSHDFGVTPVSHVGSRKKIKIHMR